MAAGLGSLGLGHGHATFMPTRTQSLSSPDQLDWCLLRKGNCGGQTRADPRCPHTLRECTCLVLLGKPRSFEACAGSRGRTLRPRRPQEGLRP